QTVHGRGRAGDDGEVVRVGEARELGSSDGVHAALDELGDPRHEPAFERVLEIRRVATVETEDPGALGRDAVGAAVDLDRAHAPTASRSRIAPSSAPNAFSTSGPSVPMQQTRKMVLASAPWPA